MFEKRIGEVATPQGTHTPGRYVTHMLKDGRRYRWYAYAAFFHVRSHCGSPHSPVASPLDRPFYRLFVSSFTRSCIQLVYPYTMLRIFSINNSSPTIILPNTCLESTDSALAARRTVDKGLESGLPPVALLTFATSPLRPSQFLETVDLATPLSVASLCAGDLPSRRSPDLSSPTWYPKRSGGWCLEGLEGLEVGWRGGWEGRLRSRSRGVEKSSARVLEVLPKVVLKSVWSLARFRARRRWIAQRRICPDVLARV